MGIPVVAGDDRQAMMANAVQLVQVISFGRFGERAVELAAHEKDAYNAALMFLAAQFRRGFRPTRMVAVDQVGEMVPLQPPSASAPSWPLVEDPAP